MVFEFIFLFVYRHLTCRNRLTLYVSPYLPLSRSIICRKTSWKHKKTIIMLGIFLRETRVGQKIVFSSLVLHPRVSVQLCRGRPSGGPVQISNVSTCNDPLIFLELKIFCTHLTALIKASLSSTDPSFGL